MSAATSGGAVFGAGDYAVFAVLLLVSAAIGVFYAWKDRKEKDAEAYLVGKRVMSPIPVAISLCVSYVSGLLMVGFPTQVYYFGSITVWCSAVYFVGPLIADLYFIPLYFRLNIMSVYEILELRFGKISRIVASTSAIVLLITYMGMVTYIPCLSLSAVSDTPMAVSICLTCAVCTFYTALGGIKAVIWTDVVQAGVMVLGMICVIVKTTMAMGGPENIVDALARGERLNFNEWSWDPYLRFSNWSILLGLPVAWTMMSAVNQPMVQRFLSCKSVKHAKRAVWLLFIPQQVFFWLAFLTGCVMYAYFEGCDPLLSNQIELSDQALPYLVVNLFQNSPGLAGVFVAAVYSGTLSTISSGISALSSVILSDYILKARPSLASRSLYISKTLAFVLGAVVLGMTFVISALEKMVIDLFLTFYGSIGGPLLAVYTMGMFLPWTNEKGAVCGQLAGIAFSFWLSIGQLIYPPSSVKLQLRPVFVDQCPQNISLAYAQNYTALSPPTVTDNYRPPIADYLYAISSNYVGLIGFVVCLIVGLLVSFITGFENPKLADTRIFTPIIDNKRLPSKVVRLFRFGVPVHKEETYIKEVHAKTGGV